jgi:membrane protein
VTTAPEPPPDRRRSLGERVAGIAAASDATIARLRARWAWFDHLARAGGRYRRRQGDLMAAGVTYFGFLSLFPILLLIASVVGLVLSGNTVLQEELYDAIREAVPGSTGQWLVEQVQDAISSAGVVGLIGLGGFLYAGLRTIDQLRIGMERIWKGRVDDPEFLRDNLQDLVALVALFGAGLLSLVLTGGVTQATSRVLTLLGVDDAVGYGVLTWVLGITLALAGDTVVFIWLLRFVPSVNHPFRLLLPGALFGAVGLEVLKLLGGFYLSLISNSVTASAFGGAVGILVWINVVARFSFYTAAWTASLPAIEAVATPPPGDAGSPDTGGPASPATGGRRPGPMTAGRGGS